MLVRDDSTDNWESDRATFVLMDPNRRGRNTYAGPPSRNPHPIPYFTMPVPAHCHKMLEDCEDDDVDKRLLRDGRMSFHYFHPMVSEILMYPEVPPPPSGRESLEWYQISHMRHRNPQMMTYGELENVWDKMTNPERDNFLDKHDYQQILTTLQNNIRAKGAGKSNFNWRATAHPMTQNAWNETLADIIEDTASNMSTGDHNRPPREELHAYLAPEKGEKGKGKGDKTAMRPERQVDDDTQTQRQRTGEP